jgi:DNA-binding MarR family transcriptional regulator
MPRELPPELDVFLVLHLAAGAAWPLIRREFEAEGLVLGNWGVLVHIGARGRMTPSELAAETGVRTTTVRDQLQAFVDRGSLRRVDNPLDARSYFVTLTEQGRDELERGVAASRRVQSALEEVYGPIDDLHAQLLRFIEACSKLLEQIEGEERTSRIDAALETDLAQ